MVFRCLLDAATSADYITTLRRVPVCSRLSELFMDSLVRPGNDNFLFHTCKSDDDHAEEINGSDTKEIWYIFLHERFSPVDVIIDMFNFV